MFGCGARVKANDHYEKHEFRWGFPICWRGDFLRLCDFEGLEEKRVRVQVKFAASAAAACAPGHRKIPRDGKLTIHTLALCVMGDSSRLKEAAKLIDAATTFLVARIAARTRQDGATVEE